MGGTRAGDALAGPADERMAAYLEGRHHPQQALSPRAAWIATEGAETIGYVAGHLTHRFGCDGELQYLYVAPPYRRNGVARALVTHLAAWFAEQGARRVCVNVDTDSPGAQQFYASLGAEEVRPHWMAWRDIGSLKAPPETTRGAR
jgi:GNAT superfamily N-acetyltransferase